MIDWCYYESVFSKEKALPAYERSAGPLRGAATAGHAHEPSTYHRIASRRRQSPGGGRHQNGLTPSALTPPADHHRGGGLALCYGCRRKGLQVGLEPCVSAITT